MTSGQKGPHRRRKPAPRKGQALSRLPVYEGDFFADSVIADPLPAYRQMRDTGPIVWLPENNVWAAVAYQPCLEILRKPKLFLSGRGLSLNDEVNNILIGSTLNSDAERHRRQRSITATAIMPDALTSLAPAIERAADDVADAVCAAGRFDAVAEFASILPLSIVVDLVGLPAHGKARMLEWAAATFNLFEGFNERSRDSFQGLRELRDFLNEFGKPEKMHHGGLARRIFDEAPGKGVPPEEAAQMLRDYIAPSLDTTISTAAYLAWHFADSPDQWQLVREDKSLIGNAVEEVVRLTTPIRAFSRYVAEDVEMHGVSMKQGQRVLVVYASANRDETVFPDADRFDVTRKTHRHLGFGQGPHMCMGMHLARLELNALIRTMAERVASWHLDGVPQTAINNTIRAFSYLPMRVERA